MNWIMKAQRESASMVPVRFLDIHLGVLSLNTDIYDQELYAACLKLINDFNGRIDKSSQLFILAYLLKFKQFSQQSSDMKVLFVDTSHSKMNISTSQGENRDVFAMLSDEIDMLSSSIEGMPSAKIILQKQAYPQVVAGTAFKIEFCVGNRLKIPLKVKIIGAQFCCGEDGMPVVISCTTNPGITLKPDGHTLIYGNFIAPTGRKMLAVLDSITLEICNVFESVIKIDSSITRIEKPALKIPNLGINVVTRNVQVDITLMTLQWLREEGKMGALINVSNNSKEVAKSCKLYSLYSQKKTFSVMCLGDLFPGDKKEVTISYDDNNNIPLLYLMEEDFPEDGKLFSVRKARELSQVEYVWTDEFSCLRLSNENMQTLFAVL